MVKETTLDRDLIETLLRQFVSIYANTEHLDHDAIEIALFSLWLRCVTALGYTTDGTPFRVQAHQGE